MSTLHLTGTLTREDKARDDYAYLPFEIPADNIVRVDVRYRVSRPRDAADLTGTGNTIDIGIFDPRGIAFGPSAGFRGWSGSDRESFYIGLDEATPGYLAGPIQPGRWHIILGLYNIAAEGCQYAVEITLTQGEGRAAPHALDLPGWLPALSGGAGWYRGDLQCHTHHSDGKGSLETLLSTAQTRGLDFLAVTDHNTVSHIMEFPDHAGQRPLLIPATEVTTYYGHMNVWGLRAWQEFRCGRADTETMRSIIDFAHEAGYLCSVNHPKTDGPPWDYGDLPFDCVEAWQAPWPFRNEESLAFWETLLASGRRVIAVGGSDYHQPLRAMQPCPHLLGQPTTWVQANELSISGILGAIRAGRVCVSDDVDGARLELRVREGENWREMGDELPGRGGPIDATCHVLGGDGGELRLVADGAVVASTAVSGAEWRGHWSALGRPTRSLRAELVRHNPAIGGWLMLAMGNPVFFRAP